MIDTPPRFYKPNDPYYYEVDNLPIEDLIKNCVDLQTQVDSLVSDDVYVVDSWLSVFLNKTDYDARTLFDTPDVIGYPQEGDVLEHSGGVWQPTPLYKSITEVFSDLDLGDAEENVFTDSGALTYRFANGEFNWLAGQTYNSNFQFSSWDNVNLYPGTDIGFGAWNATDRWFSSKTYNSAHYPVMLLHDFDVNGHAQNGALWTQRLPDPDLASQNHPEGMKKWVAHSDTFGDCVRYQSDNAAHKPSASNPFITNRWIENIAAGSLATTEDMTAFTGLQMLLSSVTWAADSDSKVPDGYGEFGQQLYKSRWEKLDLTNTKDWYLDTNTGAYEHTNSLGFQGSYVAPGGLTIKWGRHVVSWSENDVRAHDFDVPFKNKCIATYATCNAPISSRAYYNNQPPLTAGTFVQVHDFSTDRIRIRLNKVRSTSCFTWWGFEYCLGYDLHVAANWVAIGY